MKNSTKFYAKEVMGSAISSVCHVEIRIEHYGNFFFLCPKSFGSFHLWKAKPNRSKHSKNIFYVKYHTSHKPKITKKNPLLTKESLIGIIKEPITAALQEKILESQIIIIPHNTLQACGSTHFSISCICFKPSSYRTCPFFFPFFFP